MTVGMDANGRKAELVELSRFLGDPRHDLAVLAEGNASCREDEGSFWVKASGYSMRDLGEEGLTRVRFAPILEAMEFGKDLEDEDVRDLLMQCREGDGAKPSVETFLHAFLLSLPDVAFVGHTHPTAVLSLVCMEGAARLSETRLCPDEIVCCGPATAWVPYVDPGLVLARAVKDSVVAFVEKHGCVPKTIWMENHGLIALGKSPAEVQAATVMGVKMARVYLGVLATGRPIHALSPASVRRIQTRPDEKYRQKLLEELGR